MNKVLNGSLVLILLLIFTAAPVSAQVIGGTNGATGQINENGSPSSSFQQAPNQNQPSGNTSQNSSSTPLFEELTNAQLTVTGAAPTTTPAVSEKDMNIGLILFLIVVTFGVLFALYKLNKDGLFDTKEYENMDINVDEPLKTSAEVKKTKAKTKTKKKKSKKHHR